MKDFTGSLPWLSAMIGLPWTAYGVSQACYYRKAEKENTKDGIKFETTMADYNQVQYTYVAPYYKEDNTIEEDLIDIYYGL